MQADQTIVQALKFLTTEYDMEFVFKAEGCENFYYYSNAYGSFNYYEWAQFKEEEFSVTINGKRGKKIINWFLEYPQIVGAYRAQHKGIKWFFKDTTKDYWEMIASIIRLELEKKGTLFGLKVLKNNS